MTSIHVKKLPVDPGPAAWNDILPSRVPANPLRERRTADWLVIGAGFAGLSAARRLRQLRADDTIAVLEACRVGEGPAGRNSGFMIDLPHDLSSDNYANASDDRDLQQIRMNRSAIEFAREAAAAAVERDLMLPEAFVPNGKINAAATEKGQNHIVDYSRHLERLGEPYEILDHEDMRRVTGTGFYRAGLFTPGTAMLQPAAYIRGLANDLSHPDAAAKPVALYENSPVTGLTRSAGVWTAETPEGAVEAPAIILAVNGHANSFGFFERRLMHVFTYASMTRALEVSEIAELGGEPFWSCTPADPMGTTVRRVSGTGGHRIVIRNRFTYDPSMEVGQARVDAVARDHDRAFQNRFPGLKAVSMQYRWGGRLCLSWNGVPAFGEVDDGIFAACCQNGLGVAKGTLAGMLAAELAARGNNPMVAEMLALEAPKKLPPEPLAWLGANATMRWNEHRAGREL